MFLHFPSLRIDKKVFVIGKHDFAYSLYHFLKKNYYQEVLIFMYKICQYGVPNSRFLVPDLANPEKKQKLGNSYVTYQINALGKLMTWTD